MTTRRQFPSTVQSPTHIWLYTTLSNKFPTGQTPHSLYQRFQSNFTSKPLKKSIFSFWHGSVQLTRVGTNLLSTLIQIQEACIQSTNPLSFEQINHGRGFVLYTNTLSAGGKTLMAPNIRDYGYVYVNNVYQGVLLRSNQTSITINANPGDILRILVENAGRSAANYLDFKVGEKLSKFL